MNNTNNAKCASNNNLLQLVDTREKFLSMHNSYTLIEKILDAYDISHELALTLLFFIYKDSNSIPPITTNQELADHLHCTTKTIFRKKDRLRELGIISWDIVNKHCSRIKIDYTKLSNDIRNAKNRSNKAPPIRSKNVDNPEINNALLLHRDAQIVSSVIPQTQLNETSMSPILPIDETLMSHHTGHQCPIKSVENQIKLDTYERLRNKKEIRKEYIAQNDQKTENDETSRQDVRIDTTSDITEGIKPESTKQNQPIKKPTAKTKLSFDFEAAYKLYPRHVGKTKGIAKCVREIKTQKDYDDLITAINNFREAFSSREVRFIKQFDTFMSSWRDYVNKGDFDDDSGTSSAVYELFKTIDAIQ